MAGRLHDEVRHLTVLVNAIVAPREPLPPVAALALTEAFLVHARVLAHFLHPPAKPRASDAVAADFFATARGWDKVRLAPSEHLAPLRATEPRIAYGGAVPEPPDAEGVLRIAGELSAGVSVFLAHAPRQALGAHWEHVRNR